MIITNLLPPPGATSGSTQEQGHARQVRCCADKSPAPFRSADVRSPASSRGCPESWRARALECRATDATVPYAAPQVTRTSRRSERQQGEWRLCPGSGPTCGEDDKPSGRIPSFSLQSGYEPRSTMSLFAPAGRGMSHSLGLSGRECWTASMRAVGRAALRCIRTGFAPSSLCRKATSIGRTVSGPRHAARDRYRRPERGTAQGPGGSLLGYSCRMNCR